MRLLLCFIGGLVLLTTCLPSRAAISTYQVNGSVNAAPFQAYDQFGNVYLGLNNQPCTANIAIDSNLTPLAISPTEDQFTLSPVSPTSISIAGKSLSQYGFSFSSGFIDVIDTSTSEVIYNMIFSVSAAPSIPPTVAQTFATFEMNLVLPSSKQFSDPLLTDLPSLTSPQFSYPAGVTVTSVPEPSLITVPIALIIWRFRRQKENKEAITQ